MKNAFDHALTLYRDGRPVKVLQPGDTFEVIEESGYWTEKQCEAMRALNRPGPPVFNVMQGPGIDWQKWAGLADA